MKTIKLAVWFLSTLIFLTLAASGYFNKETIVVIGLLGFASLYSMTLLAHYPNPRDLLKLKYKMDG